MWDLVELLVTAICKSGRGVQPGAHIAPELVFWSNLLYVNFPFPRQKEREQQS